MTVVYTLSEQSPTELFVSLFGAASRGWIFPVHTGSAEDLAPLKGETDGPLGFSRFEGDAITASLAAQIQEGHALGLNIWCALTIRVPEGDALRRRCVLRKSGVPLAQARCANDTLQLIFDADDFPFSTPKDEALRQTAVSAKDELEALFERTRALRIKVTRT